MDYTIIWFAFILLSIILIVYSATMKEKGKDAKDMRYIALEEKRSKLQEEINNLEGFIELNRVDPKTNLKKYHNNVLDIYEQSNIRVPLDIIEQLTYMELDTEKEVFEFIENQRLYWKLENTKKPYKRK